MVITRTEPALEIRAYARIYVQLSETPEFQDEWLQIINQAEKAVKIRIESRVDTLYLSRIMGLRISHLKQKVQRIRRVRRGLFDFVGELGSSLFGIPSPKDIEALKQANQLLADTMSGVVKTQKEVVGRVNLLGQQQKRMMATVNQLIDRSSAQAADIEHLGEAVTALDRYLKVNVDFMLVLMSQLDIVEQSMIEYSEVLAQVQAVRVACEAGKVTEQMLPIRVVKGVLSSGENFRTISPLRYYPYIQVEKIMTTASVNYCVLKAPLFTETSPVKVLIHTFPICQQGKCVQLYQPPEFIVDYGSEELYFPDSCEGPIPQACQPGVKYDKNHQLCLHGLINGDTFQQQQCPMDYYASPPPPVL